MLGSAIPAESVRLPAEPSSCTQARHFVMDWLNRWGLEDQGDFAGLCVTELATNAVLHSREPFVVTVRPAGDGVRIDVLDNCPHHLPISTPDRGSAVDLTSWGTAGRGMQIVASLAFRWGISTTDEAKTVWVELQDQPARESRPGPTEPVLSLTHESPMVADSILLKFLHLPVRAAVASGIQTEEVIREIQLDQASAERHDDEAAIMFFDLVDRSASVRLPGRYAALRAAADGREHFDVTLRCTSDALASLSRLARALAQFESVRSLPHPALTDDVIAFRAWLDSEGTRQRAGGEPLVCPLP